MKKGDKALLRTYIHWMRPGAILFYLLAIVLAYFSQKGLLFAWTCLFLGIGSYVLGQTLTLGQKEGESLHRLINGVRRGLLVYSGFFALLWIGLIFYLYS